MEENLSTPQIPMAARLRSSNIKIVVYGRDKPFCTYCNQAKNLLTSHNISFSYIRVGEDITVENLQTMIPGAKTVPQIFFNDILIGGFKELQEFFKQ